MNDDFIDDIYNSLNDIEDEEGIAIDSKAFIADCLADKLKKLGYEKKVLL